MSGFKIDGTALLKNLIENDSKVKAACKLFGENAGNELVVECKKDATWTDRTGLSRQTIDSEVISRDGKTEIRIRGNTPHFKYLELAHEKKYAILFPTVKKNMERIKKAWARSVWK